jgi:hypothetical protein
MAVRGRARVVTTYRCGSRAEMIDVMVRSDRLQGPRVRGDGGCDGQIR